jgi:hypothetical protein
MWSRLKCPCDGEKFAQLVHLKAHPSEGTATEFGGYQCVACGKIVDIGKLTQDHRLRQKKEELRALTAEIQGTSPTS